MRKVTMFNFATLNGYFKGPNGEIQWHRHGAEENEYSAQSLQHGNTLVFGRVTYEMMASVWPTPDAIKNMPVVAAGMNNADKIVFSRTLQKADWNNTRLVKGDLEKEIKKLKQLPGQDLTILGSGSIVTQLADAGLIDVYQIMIDPVVLGEGASLLRGLRHPLNLKLTDSKTFKSGTVLLTYEPLEK